MTVRARREPGRDPGGRRPRRSDGEPAPVGVVGAGTMGRAVARLAARAGHRVVLGSRRSGREVDQPGVTPGSWADAARAGGLVFLATLWRDLDEVVEAVRAAGPAPGRIVVDCGNPEAGEGPGLVLGTDTSGAEVLAGRLPDGPPVVKALNHVYAGVLDAGPALAGGPRAAAFYCGDDAEARSAVGRFLAGAGFDAVDAGPLAVARFLEPAAQLVVALVRERGMPPADVALGLLRRV